MVCLDTSFLIDVILGRPVVNKFEEIMEGEEQASIASPSIIEITKGLHLKKNPSYVSETEKNKIEKVLSSMIVLDLDKDCAILAGEIEADLINKGQIIDVFDIMIGAIAKHNGETLLTNNKKHFEKIPGLDIKTY